MKTFLFTIITSVLRSVAAARAVVLAALLIGASNTNLQAATFSDDNWTGMGGHPGANGPVSATVVDGSGNLYIGGGFTVVGDVFANSIAKWDGTNWSALGSGMEGNSGFWPFGPVVHALAVSGNDLYAAGYFTTAGGIAANNIAKWNGTNWSALNAGVDNWVEALAVSGSDLYAAGQFVNAGGLAANRIAKWNGSSWSALGLGISGAPPNPSVLALAVSGSDLYVGGSFTNAGGITANGIAKWDGSSWSALGSGMNERVTTLAVSGSDVYAAGDFSTNVAKWNGSSWSALDSAVGSGLGFPKTLAVSGGDLYAGGNLLTWVGPGASTYGAYVAKWNGSSWVELGSGIYLEWGESWDPQVYALAVAGTNVYTGGAFRRAGDVTAHCIAKWNGSNWSALAPTFVYLNAVTASGRDVYGAGVFAAADGTQSNYVAKWNGTNWSALGSKFQGDASFRPLVAALAVSGSDLYAGGAFTNAGGTPANRIAMWNGSNWSALGSGMDWTNRYIPIVYALAVSGNALYAGGQFTSAGGIAANNIAKWNGTNWSALGSGIGPWLDGGFATVSALAVLGRNLYAGGIFTAAGGSPANYIAKWDGNSWSALCSGMGGSGSAPGYVTALAVLCSDLYAGGYFTTAGGITVRCVAKWDGSSWSALGSGMESDDGNGTTPYVYALAVSGNDLYVGGLFTAADGTAANYIARWNGSGWFDLGSGMDRDSVVRNLAASSTELFAAGGFTRAGGKISPYLARARIGSIAKSVAPTNSAASIQFSGVTGYQYDVQRATNLTPQITWTTVTPSPLSPASDGAFTFTDTNAPRGTAFYRAVER